MFFRRAFGVEKREIEEERECKRREKVEVEKNKKEMLFSIF